MEPDVAELPEAAADGMGMPMLASILLPLLIAVFFLFRGIGAGGGDKIVLFGPMGAGKTSMYLHLRFGHAIPSHTSMRVTTSTFTPQGGGNAAAYKPLTVVDVPGEPRLNYQLLAELPSAAV